MVGERNTLLEVKALKKYFPIQRGILRRTIGHIKAVDRVDLYVEEGETLGLVGESGCGKTTLGRTILRVYEPTDGEILFRNDDQMISVTHLDRKALKSFRRNMQMTFQDPFSSLNPRMTVLEIVGEPLLIHGIAKGKELEDRVAETLTSVGLKVEHLRRYPHSFSGGQRQRIGVARALILNPQFIVADEPVSAVDMSVQAQIINLLEDLQDQFHLTYLFISHDISLVRHVSDRIAVMYVGKIIEAAEKEELLGSPKHPYAEALLSAVPRPDPHYRSERIILSGEVADPANPPPGCVFHTRCRYVQEVCRREEPPFCEVAPEHYASCHFADKLVLTGIPAE
jgi:peptide/nickel transport system ATP-binding protein